MADFVSHRIAIDVRGLANAVASRKIAEVAHERQAAVLAASDPKPEVKSWVDGVEGAPFEAVKPTGMILIRFLRFNVAFDWIWERLLYRSPYAPKRPNADPPTHYADEHRIFINGIEAKSVPRDLSGVAEIVIANTTPYARKIERGLSLMAPDGVYEMVAREAKERFGTAVGIEFDYRSFPGQGPRSGLARARGGTQSDG